MKIYYFLGYKNNIGKTTTIFSFINKVRQNKKVYYLKPIAQEKYFDTKEIELYMNKINFTNMLEHYNFFSFKQDTTKHYNEIDTKKIKNFIVDNINEKLKKMYQLNVDYVIIEGIGQLSTGSILGIGNLDILQSINYDIEPVLILEPGIGNCIDNIEFCFSYFKKYNIKLKKIIFNKVKKEKKAMFSEHITEYLKEKDIEVSGYVYLVEQYYNINFNIFKKVFKSQLKNEHLKIMKKDFLNNDIVANCFILDSYNYIDKQEIYKNNMEFVMITTDSKNETAVYIPKSNSIEISTNLSFKEVKLLTTSDKFSSSNSFINKINNISKESEFFL